MMKKQLIIFDFDGTIADTLTVAVEIFNVVGCEFGLPKLTQEQFAELKQKRIHELMDLAGLSLVQLPMFIKRVREEFNTRREVVEPIAGMVEVIQHLHQAGFPMGILTSNTQANVLHFLDKFGINHFDFIVAPGSIFGKAGALKDILKKHKLKAKQVIMVGDEMRDIKAAHKCKVDIIAVDWGFNAPELLEKGKPRFLARNPFQLIEIFGLQPA
jgi:phosphoglycolate phosphatase